MVLFGRMATVTKSPEILVIEDDEVSREILRLQLSGAGYQVSTASDGDDALLLLDRASSRSAPARSLPDLILSDLHMPGTSGNTLARRLRVLCPPTTVLLAMSANTPKEAEWNDFDGFLLKPFQPSDLQKPLQASLERSEPPVTQSHSGRCLDPEIFEKLSLAMPVDRLFELYELCLTDTKHRIATMKVAANSGDDATFRREAHAIRGGSAIVGAAEMQHLAWLLEENGLQAEVSSASLQHMLEACERLRTILFATRSNSQTDTIHVTEGVAE